MYAQVEKTKENKSRVVANSVTQKKSNGKQGFGFVDNRYEATTQRQLQNAGKIITQVRHNFSSNVIQKKIDHLFNKIPKTLKDDVGMKVGIRTKPIYDILNPIREDDNNKKDGVHTGVDPNSAKFGNAKNKFVNAFNDYKLNQTKNKKAEVRKAGKAMWDESVDLDVGKDLDPVNKRNDVIAKWNGFEHSTIEAVLLDHSK